MDSELKRLLYHDFGAFHAKVFTELSGALPDHGPYLRLMCTFAATVARGQIKRGIVNLPPRHAKTITFVISLVAWMIGHNAKLKVMLLSYGETLSQDTASKLRQIMKTDWYSEVFQTRLSKERFAVMDFATKQGGQVFSTSFGGPITGRGADFIVIDDPVKIGDAGNLDMHNKVADSIEVEVLSRLNNRKKGQVLIVGHRLHPEDVFARYEDDPSWTKLSLPLVADHPMVHKFGSEVWKRKAGELLRPEGFTEEDIKGFRNNPQFEALYQQNPSGVPWEPLTEESFPPYPHHIPEAAPLVVSIDPAQAANARASHWVAQAWAILDGRFVLVDQIREQSGYDGMLSVMSGFLIRHRPSVILIEKAGGGCGLAKHLRRNYRDRVVEIPAPTTSKLDRLKTCMGLIQSKKVLIGADVSFREEFIDEVTSFPHTDSTDQVDAMTQFLNHIMDVSDVPARTPRALSNFATRTGIGTYGFNISVSEASCGNGMVALGRRPRWY